ncbi:MAG: histone deacetylase family protein [Candidatus Binataceae bacterium]
MRTALITDRRYLRHRPGRLHPERPERVAVMIEMAEHLHRAGIEIHAPRYATRDEVALCHEQAYITEIERTAAVERFHFDPDTHTSAETYDTAMLAAGGVLTAVEAVIDGAAHNAFAIVRPPGHHAAAGHAMGFCFFNNVAIAAAWLHRVRGLQRILIVDWDVHHGNGTQEIFYRSPAVLYMSTHQYPFYPGTGALDEIGTAAGAGYTVNAPLPAGFGDDEYLRVFDDLFIPVARQFKPDFILVSAGFDCDYRDPLGSMRVTEHGFVEMTRRIKRLAAEYCEGRLAIALEGGYDLEALSSSGRAVIEEMRREADEPLTSVERCGRVPPIIQRARYFLRRYWNFDS